MINYERSKGASNFLKLFDNGTISCHGCGTDKFPGPENAWAGADLSCRLKNSAPVSDTREQNEDAFFFVEAGSEATISTIVEPSNFLTKFQFQLRKIHEPELRLAPALSQGYPEWSTFFWS